MEARNWGGHGRLRTQHGRSLERDTSMGVCRRWLPAALVAVWSCGGADDGGLSGAAPNNTDDSAAISEQALTFTEILVEFQTGCLGQGCHEGLLAQVGVRLDDYDAAYDILVNDGPLGALNVPCGDRFVVPGDPDSSVLVMQLAGTCGSIMPPEPAAVWDPQQIEGLRAWIRAGAPKN